MIKNGIFEIGDQFLLPCGKEFESERFVVVGIRKFNDEFILEAICKESEIKISVNSKNVEMLGKEFHTG